ncbi:hypothetical protein ABG067_002710 [Albugo candida]
MSDHEKMLLAIETAREKRRPYFPGRHFSVYTGTSAEYFRPRHAGDHLAQKSKITDNFGTRKKLKKLDDENQEKALLPPSLFLLGARENFHLREEFYDQHMRSSSSPCIDISRAAFYQLDLKSGW